MSVGSDLEGMERSCTNAWKLYKRTRPAASPESVARTREMAAAGVHPMLAAALPQASLMGAEAEVVALARSSSSWAEIALVVLS